MEFFDSLEGRDRHMREAELFQALRRLLTHAKAHSPWYAKALPEIHPEAVTDRRALAALPVLYKSQLVELQAEAPPFGGIAAKPAHTFRRLFHSPGPISEPQGAGDHWRMARALFAAGFRQGDIVANCFSYHLTPAGFMFDHACAELGCAVFPGGTGNVETQVEAIRRLGVTGYVGTPDFLKIIMEKAESLSTPVESIRAALVTGGPLFPALRDWYAEHGVSVRQCYGTAELGLIAYEAAGPADGMVMNEHCIVEIVRPGTGEPVPDGEVGEVVVTTFDEAYPLIRFATGDLSAVMAGQSPCGRTNARLKGWMGRADQTTKVRGMFVHPRQVANLVKRFPAVLKARIEVTEIDGRDQLRLLAECRTPEDGLAASLEEAVRAECRLRGEVALLAPNSLPNDGKVIDDKRVVGV
jgi:phenylacetate-CoA ligase